MAALAGTTARDQLTLGLVEADELDSVGGTVLCPEGGAVEADTSLHADQVGPESGGERPLHEEHVGSVERRGGDLSISSLVDASRIDDLACKGMSVSLHGFFCERLKGSTHHCCGKSDTRFQEHRHLP